MIQFSTKDLITPEGLERVLRQIQSDIRGTISASTVKLPDAATLASQLSPYLRNLLQAPGSSPLNLTALIPFTGQGIVIEDTHANRIALYPAVNYAVGSLFYETDRTVLYATVSSGGSMIWQYIAGTYAATLASIPIDLGLSDRGFIFITTDAAPPTKTAFQWSGLIFVRIGLTTTSSAVDGHLVVYDGTTGQLVKDGGAVNTSVSTYDINGLRLTLSSGNPIYTPQSATPNSTDTTAETVSFAAAHGWTNATIVTPSAAGGGLNLAQLYWIHVVSSTSVSFHTNVADALAGSSPVNLTASITAQLMASGVSNSTIYLTPYTSTQISLYTGSAWSVMTSNEVSLALGTLSNNTQYDVFAYNSSGTLTLEFVAWASDSARTTAIVQQDGVWVKSGTLAKRLVGTFRTDTTTTTIDDASGQATLVSAKRFLINTSNRVTLDMFTKDRTSSWAYSTATWRQAGGSAGDKLETITPLPGDRLTADLDAQLSKDSNSAEGSSSIGLDATNLPNLNATIAILTGPVNSALHTLHSMMRASPAVGYHTIVWLERGSGTATTTWYGYDSTNNNRMSGLSGTVMG